MINNTRITDISHLAPSSKQTESFTSPNDFLNDAPSRSFTIITDLYNDKASNLTFEDNTTQPPYSYLDDRRHEDEQHHQPCTIRCTDILKHITDCPVCSKLYQKIEPTSSMANSTCKDGRCWRNKNKKIIMDPTYDKYESDPSINKFYMAFMFLSILVVLFLLKMVLNK